MARSPHVKTRGFETSGEKGTHLIKLEITDMKDLKEVKQYKLLETCSEKGTVCIE